MAIVSVEMVNYVNSAIIQYLYSCRKGRNRDYLIGILKGFLIKKGAVISGTVEDIPVNQYCMILIKSVNDKVYKSIAKGLSRKIINKLLLKGIKESIGDIKRWIQCK